MGCRTGKLVAALAGWLMFAVPGAAFGGEAQWMEVKSPHFSVLTDGGEKRGRAVAIRFEQMRAVYGALLVKSNVNLPVPLQVVAFRNTKELRQFTPLWNGRPTEVAGPFPRQHRSQLHPAGPFCGESMGRGLSRVCPPVNERKSC